MAPKDLIFFKWQNHLKRKITSVCTHFVRCHFYWMPREEDQCPLIFLSLSSLTHFSLFLLLSFLSRVTTRLWIQVAMNWIQSLSDQWLKCNQKRMTGLSFSPNVSCWVTRIPLSLLPSLTFSVSGVSVLSRKERDQVGIMKTTHERIVTEKGGVGKRTSFKVN